MSCWLFGHDSFVYFRRSFGFEKSENHQPSHEEELRKAKDIAISEMVEQAQSMGANAVVGVDLDYETIGGGSGNMLMVSASGTAVYYVD